MMARTGFIFVVVLQATTIGLLLYVAFEQKNAAVRVYILPSPVEARADVESEDRHGLSDEDIAHLKNLRVNGGAVSETKRYNLSEFQIVKPIFEKTVSHEFGEIPDELIQELMRYRTMSEQEKRQLEADVSKELFDGKGMREMTETLSEILHKIDTVFGELEVEQ